MCGMPSIRLPSISDIQDGSSCPLPRKHSFMTVVMVLLDYLLVFGMTGTLRTQIVKLFNKQSAIVRELIGGTVIQQEDSHTLDWLGSQQLIHDPRRHPWISVWACYRPMISIYNLCQNARVPCEPVSKASTTVDESR